MHGPLLYTGSQAWSNDESLNSNTKSLEQLKCNTSMHQAITDIDGLNHLDMPDIPLISYILLYLKRKMTVVGLKGIVL